MASTVPTEAAGVAGRGRSPSISTIQSAPHAPAAATTPNDDDNDEPPSPPSPRLRIQSIRSLSPSPSPLLSSRQQSPMTSNNSPSSARGQTHLVPTQPLRTRTSFQKLAEEQFYLQDTGGGGGGGGGGTLTPRGDHIPTSPSVSANASTATLGSGTGSRSRSNTQGGTAASSSGDARPRSSSVLFVIPPLPGQSGTTSGTTMIAGSSASRQRKEERDGQQAGRSRGPSTAKNVPPQIQVQVQQVPAQAQAQGTTPTTIATTTAAVTSSAPPVHALSAGLVGIPPGAKIRHTPRMPHHPAEEATPTAPYWSKCPIWGHLPDRGVRGHSTTLVDNVIWQIGGCDASNACYSDIVCLNADTMQWFHPEASGDVPPPCRAHSATAVGHRIFLFGGGADTEYFNTLHVLDTLTRKWTKVTQPPEWPAPIPRRAHATWVFQNKLYLFGGGNGSKALNDVWTLNVNAPYEEMRWECVDVRGAKKPGARGYHSATLVKDMVIIIGGSDGTYVFNDVWLLHLGKMQWHLIPLESLEGERRLLGHSATQVGSYLFVFGGHNGADYSNDLLLLNLVTLSWEERSPRGRRPPPRGYHGAILYDSRIFFIAGFDGSNVYDDVYILDLAAAAYLPQVATFNVWPDLGLAF